jgi:hypothetical protein
MLRPPSVNNVLVQATYMSGDRYTIATALKLNQKLGILLIYDYALPATANEMKNFYETSGKARGRIELIGFDCGTGSEQEKNKVLSGVYKNVTAGPRPEWLSGYVDARIKIQTATYGTKVITSAFRGGGRTAPAAAALATKQVNEQWAASRPKAASIANWLSGDRKFGAKKKYVFLWCKEGPRTAEKAHHFTSILTWRLLQEKIARELPGWVPVAAGDPIGITTVPILTEFWKMPTWQALFKPKQPSREDQLATWQVIASHYRGRVCSVGLRSGAMEVPALMGIPTLYVEEKSNAQAGRMEKWIGAVPGFERLRTDAAWGLKQQLSWKNDTLRYTQVRDRTVRERTLPNNLHGVQLGSNLAQIKEVGRNPRGAPDIHFNPVLNTWFDQASEDRVLTTESHVLARHSLLTQIKRNQLSATNAFGARDEEVQAIVDWIKSK